MNLNLISQTMELKSYYSILFNIISINIPENDVSLAEIKKAKNLSARLKITGKETYLGRWFIKTYYYLSPPVAEKLKNAKFINKFIRSLLNKWIKHLRKKH